MQDVRVSPVGREADGALGGAPAGGGAMRLLRAAGIPAAAGLAFGGQFLVSLRGASVWAALVPGLALYALAFALLGFALRGSRQAAPAGGEEERWLAGRAGWILLAVVLAAGFYLRVYHIDLVPWGLNNDEAINAIEANEIAHGKAFATMTVRGLNRETMFHYLAAYSFRSPGLLLNVLRAVPAVFGLVPRFIDDPMQDAILPLRAVSIVVGTLTIALLYLFARREFGARVALLAALFLAVSPWHLLYSRAGERVILAPPFAIVCAALFLRAWRSGRLLDHLAWGLAAGLGFWTYTSFRAVPIALAAFVALRALRRRGAAPPIRPLLAGGAAMTVLFALVLALSPLKTSEFLFRGAYAAAPPQSNYPANLFSAVTMLNYFPARYAVIQSDSFISDGISTTFGLIGLEPDSLLLAALATLGMAFAVAIVLRRGAAGDGAGPGGETRAGAAAGDPTAAGGSPRDAASLALLMLLALWLTVGWLGPSLTRMLLALPWLVLCAALLAARVWDDLAALRRPLTAYAAAAVLAGVAVLATVEGFSNYFLLAGRSERAMQNFGATQTIMGMFVRSLPPDQDVTVLHTLRADTLQYLVGDRPNVRFLTDTTKVRLDTILNTPRTLTFVVEYARPFAEPLRGLMMRFPQSDMSQVADARVDPDKIIFYTFTIMRDANGQIVPAPGMPEGAPPGTPGGGPGGMPAVGPGGAAGPSGAPGESPITPGAPSQPPTPGASGSPGRPGSPASPGR